MVVQVTQRDEQAGCAVAGAASEHRCADLVTGNHDPVGEESSNRAAVDSGDVECTTFVFSVGAGRTHENKGGDSDSSSECSGTPSEHGASHLTNTSISISAGGLLPPHHSRTTH